VKRRLYEDPKLRLAPTISNCLKKLMVIKNAPLFNITPDRNLNKVGIANVIINRAG
jgi:hypothetical protein